MSDNTQNMVKVVCYTCIGSCVIRLDADEAIPCHGCGAEGFVWQELFERVRPASRIRRVRLGDDGPSVGYHAWLETKNDIDLLNE